MGWRVSMELQALTVYALDAGGARELVRTDYVNMSRSGSQRRRDAGADGVRGAENSGLAWRAADCYIWKNGALALGSTSRVSMTMAELSQQGKVTVGTLRSGETALFVTGVADGTRAITDVLLLRGGELANAVLSSTTGVSGESSRFRSLYPMDINNDGVTEVPRTVPLYGEEAETDAAQRVGTGSALTRWARPAGCCPPITPWRRAGILQLPEGWPESIWVSRSASADETAVTFYRDGVGEQPYAPVLRITALSGSNRGASGGAHRAVSCWAGMTALSMWVSC